mmetsp:Transcript_19335/g.21513  ORF Transcript_19335/g.21513 Transcript_19335/m.21513 type:complete len:141 (+) Transcript_19335:152-574(+)
MTSGAKEEQVPGEEKTAYFTPYDLRGFWQGDKGPNGLEMLQITLTDGFLVATKITGGGHVPAGKVSWKVDRKLGVGSIQVAEKGFKNSQWRKGKIEAVISPDNFFFVWENVEREFKRLHISGDNNCGYTFDHDPVNYDYD